jgi:hypothetical protein
MGGVRKSEAAGVARTINGFPSHVPPKYWRNEHSNRYFWAALAGWSDGMGRVALIWLAYVPPPRHHPTAERQSP